jgi:hypothetical protein
MKNSVIRKGLLKLSFNFCSVALISITLLGCNLKNNIFHSDVNVQTDVYLLIGQSNMAGRGVIDSIANTYLSDKVLMVTSTDSIVVAKHPLHFDKPSIDGVGPGLKFGAEMAKADKKTRILLVPCAIGGTSINKWLPEAYDSITNTYPYDDAIKRLKVAMKNGTLKGVIWHQGEGDIRRTDYLTDLIELVQRIRTTVGNPELPFIAGELGYYLKYYSPTNFNENLNKFPAALNHTAVVSAKGLTHKGDDVHFDSRSAEILGERYAEAMKELQDKKTDYLKR